MMLPVLLALACAAPLRASHASLDTSDFAIGSFTWGGDTAAARRTFGSPDSIRTRNTRVDDDDLRLTEWHYPGLLLRFMVGGHLRDARITSSHWPTRRGLAVGDSTDRVRRLYGTPWRTIGGNIYYLVSPGSQLGMFTLASRGRITTIVFGVIVEGD